MHKKVLCPIERKGRTFWMRTGTAFDNRDGSINVVLDLLPPNGRLQIRELDERDRERIQPRPEPQPVTPNEDLPF